MDFLRKLFGQKPRQEQILLNKSDDGHAQKGDTLDDSFDPTSPHADLVRSLREASKKLAEVAKTQPANRGSDDQYEYEYEMYQRGYDEASQKVKEIILALEEARAVEPIIQVLKGKDRDLGAMAAASLGKIGDTSAVESLIEALKENHLGLKVAAAKSLGKLGDGRAVEPLVNTLLKNGDSQSNNLFQTVEDALVNINDPRTDDLILMALANRDQKIRYAAARVLADKKDVSTVKSLIISLGDSYSGVRYKVATALGEIGDARAVEPLIAVLNDLEIPVRSAAAIALGNIGDARALEPLSSALDGWDQYEKRYVIDAINKIRSKNDPNAA